MTAFSSPKGLMLRPEAGRYSCNSESLSHSPQEDQAGGRLRLVSVLLIYFWYKGKDFSIAPSCLMNDQNFPDLWMEACWAQFRYFLVCAHTMHSQPPSGVALLAAQSKNK